MTSTSVVNTSLFASKAPLEWAVIHQHTLYTAQIPIDEQGQLISTDIEPQVHQIFANLQHTLQCAGAQLSDVLQVIIYVTDRSYLSTVNRIYGEYFKPPYPNRAAMIVAGLAREEMLVEFIVYAAID